MSDSYFTSPYSYQPKTRHQSSNRYDYEPNQEFKQSHISQQTIIQKAKLYSPDKNQQYGRRGYRNQMNDRTKTKKEISSRINELADLCERDREADVHQFGEIIAAQRQIFGMMREVDQSDRPLPNLDFSGANPDYDRGTTFGPIRHPNLLIQKAQSKQITQRQYSNDKQPAFRDNIYKKSAIQGLKTDRNLEEAGAQILTRDHTQDFRHQPNFNLPDGTYEMIEQIQRKAMEEIQSLRRDKIQLMRKLNEEIRAHNQQKKLRVRLQNQLAKLKGQNVKVKSHSQPHYSQNQRFFKQTQQPLPNQETQPPLTNYTPYQTLQSAKVSPPGEIIPIYEENEVLYENQINGLKNQNQNIQRNVQSPQRQNEKQALRYQISALNEKIKSYQLELQRLRATKGGNNDLLEGQALLEQGERIKFQTLRLLNQHEYRTENTNLRSFKDRQIRDQQSHQIFQDMQNFKRRLVELEEQNLKLKSNLSKGVRREYEQGFGGRASLPIRNVISKNQINSDDRMREFEQIIGDMKNAV